MPTRAQLEAEAYRRGLMPTDRAALYEEAVRRNIVPDFYAKGRVETRGKGGAMTAVASTIGEAIPGVDELQAGLGAVVDRVQGKGTLGGNYRAQRQVQAGRQDQLRQDHPNVAALSTGLGYAAQAVPALLSGGATVAPNIYAQTGLRAGTARIAAGTARNATVGASYAAGNALAGRGTLDERVASANEAIPAGAAIGVLAPAAVATPGVFARGVKRVSAPAVRATVRATNNLVTKAGREPFLDPQTEAFKRLGETLKADKFTPDEIQAALTEWNRVGGPSPAFMDLIAQGGKGQRTMALVRGSAMNGGGRNVATQYGEQVAVDLQDNAIARTRQLTPEQRTAEEVAADMRKTRGKLADTQYAGPYKTPVAVTEDVQSVLTDAPGKASLRQARLDALERRDMQQVSEIDALLKTEPVPADPYQWFTPPPKTVSGATLDRTQIAMRERGEKLAVARNNARASGTRDRRAVINRELDSVPQLAEARQAYRDASQQIEGVEKVGPRVLTDAPNIYAANVARLGPGAQPAVGVGAARSLEDAIGRPAEGSTGVLNRIGTATNTGRNLETTYGQQPAADYRQAINQMRDQLNNARFINPNMGSQTAGRISDQALVESVPTSKTGIVMALIRKVRNGATLTEAEREAIVRIATSKPSDVAERIAFNVTPPPRIPDIRSQTVSNIFAIPAHENSR